ncbi:MAG: agmatine deiminase family protein [Pirellula sp.]|nr:agmatine deiminase family protein [Pirellula sp.]
MNQESSKHPESPERHSTDANQYRWVAEWEPHEATWISWPHNHETWPGLFEAIPPVAERMIRTLAEVEKVHVLGGPPPSYESAMKQVGDVKNVEVHPILTNDCWIRDYGPTFLLNEDQSRLGAVLWKFNAWGNKYQPHDDDTAAGGRITDLLKERRILEEAFCSDLVAEGGALETDGQATLLATSSSLKTYSRNPNWNESQIESELKRLLGIERVLWIDGGELAGDDTDSHIDQLVRFVRPGVVVAAVSYSLDDCNAPKLAKQFEVLKNCVDAKGRQLEIIPLVTPPPRYIQGKRVPESYCNFYIAHEIVNVPTFGYRETDDAAIAKLGELFSSRKIIPIDASYFIWGRGAFHCATQQQPQGKRNVN